MGAIKISNRGLGRKEKLDRKKVKLSGFISFLMGFSQAVLAYVLSSYFEKISGADNVAVFYFLAYATALVLLLNFHKLARIFGKANVFYFALIFKIAALSFLMTLDQSFLAGIIAVFYLIFSILEWAGFDAMLESFSADKFSGRIRGRHLTILNAGFLSGPFLATWILDNFDYQGVFLFLFFLSSVGLFFGLFLFRRNNGFFQKKVRSRDLIRKISARKDILRIYYLSFVLEIFYAITIIYVPLYFLKLGFSWQEIGLVFTIMLLPFVFIQYPAGVLADGKMGEKPGIILSVFLMGIGSLLIFWSESKDIFVWGAILFFGRIGAALIEILRDSYFYKRIDGRDVDLINFFRTSISAGFIGAAAFSFLILSAFPLKAVFLFLAVVVFSGLWPALALEKSGTVSSGSLEKNKKSAKLMGVGVE